jgi:hypothetical protein
MRLVPQKLLDLVDERIDRRLADQQAAGPAITGAAAGTVNARTGPTTALVTLDGSSVATPVKVYGDVNISQGDRVGLARIGVDWTVTGTFTRRQSITAPLDAGAGTHRAVFGADTPAELQAYGILEAFLWYDTDKTSNIELGYFFIGSSNSLDGGANQKVLLFGNVDYPTAGVPSSATVGSVKTNFQINMFNETALGFGYTIFKDSVIQINNSVPAVFVGATNTTFNGSGAVNFSQATAWDNGIGFQRRNGGAVSVAGDPGKGLVN